MTTTDAISEEGSPGEHAENVCRVCVLGDLRIEANGSVLSRLPTQKTGLLLAYLASHPSRPHPREELIEMLWPESVLEDGRNRLRVALSAIRRTFHDAGINPDKILDVDRVAARINAQQCTTDAIEFERVLKRSKTEDDPSLQIATLEYAESLYAGDLLPGFYEEWVTTDRDRLRDLYANLLRRLGRLLIEGCEYERAIEYVRRAVDADPLSEGTHRTLIRLYVACNRPAAAHRQYETLKTILARELHTSPSVQTEDLVRRFSQNGPSHTGLEVSPGLENSVVSAALQPLPSVPTTFVGRIGELADLNEILSHDKVAAGRFLNVTGPVGVGKSRLILETIGHLVNLFAGRVFYARISGFDSTESILRAIADALQVSAAAQVEVFGAVAESLAQGPAILVLDDADLLGAGAIRVIIRLLERAPDLRIVATSRRVFGIPDEQVFNLNPLPLPTDELTLEALRSNPSVRLFLDRSQMVRKSVKVDAENYRTIVELCRRLEGIPLAIELAATWIRVLTPESMLHRLKNRFDLVRSGETAAGTEARGLYEAITVSYRLMPERLRQLLTQLSILRGDWTAATAEAVCGGEATIQNILDLTLRSFVLCDDSFGEMRFRMLDTLRDYADQQMGPAERDTLSEAHAQFFAQKGAAERAPYALEQSRWLSLMDLDYENYLAALEWKKHQRDFKSGVRLCALLWRYWYERGLHAEGLRWHSFFLGHHTAEGEDRVEALFGAARFSISLGENATASVYLNEALPIARRAPSGLHLVPLLSTLVMLARDAHNDESARELYSEWLAMPILAHQIWERMPALEGLLLEATLTKDVPVVKECRDRIDEIHARIGDVSRSAGRTGDKLSGVGGYAFLELGQTAASQNDENAARDLCLEGMDVYREVGDERGIALALDHLTLISIRSRDLSAAHNYAMESLRIRRRSDSLYGIVTSLLALGNIDKMRGLFREAEVYRNDAQRYSSEYDWVMKICLPFPSKHGA